MGGGGGGSETEVVETKLSKKQAEILKDREAFYQDFTLPRLHDYYQATKDFELNKEFENLDDLTDQMDTLFSSDPQERILGQTLMKGGFDKQTTELAQERLGAEGAVGAEGAFSATQLAAMLQRNVNTSKRNSLTQTEQGVRGAGIDAILKQTPRPSGSNNAPMIKSVSSGGDGLGALGGAAGSALTDLSSQGAFSGMFGQGASAGQQSDASMFSALTGSGG
jgi:hypothetical protein